MDDDELTFGQWLQRRRKALNLTQQQLGALAGCAAETIRKVEADTRRPSTDVAQLLAKALQISDSEQSIFLRFARGEALVELPSLAQGVPVAAPLPALPEAPVPKSSVPSLRPLPTGTVTLLFTDIVGSTQLLQRLGPRYGDVLTEYRALLRSIFQAHGGQEVDTQGDSFFVAFARALDAVNAATEIQHTLATHSWAEGVTLPTRMGLHTGEPRTSEKSYVGLDVHRAARIGALGHGGQVLLSAATRGLIAHDLPAGLTVRDLGAHRLKDLHLPEQLFQLVIADLPQDFPPPKTLDARLTNVTLPRDRLVGRDQDRAVLGDLLQRDDIGLVTLTGPGGTGKTRLALQIGADLLAAFLDGVYFVDLAPLTDPDLGLASIAQVLDIREMAGQPLLASVQAFLRDKQLLLILDNFEQVLAAGLVVAELLQAASRLKVLVTSRAPLHLRGEHEVAVEPLAVPATAETSLATVTQYDAVALFIERAQAVKAGFEVTNANAPAVAEICARLDGLPLAIELAAARVKLLPPEALLSRLGSRLQLLTGGARDLPNRQQTLRNTIEWSFQLLEPAEQTLFMRLAVFVGGWALQDAEAVVDHDGDLAVDVLDGVQSLMDKSLVRQAEGSGDEPRYTMLETIREYALEQLELHREGEAGRQAHAAYFLALAQAAAPELRGPAQMTRLDRLEREHDNLRAAMQWTVAQRDVTGAIEFGAALWQFWWLRGYLTEGRARLEAVLARVAPNESIPGNTTPSTSALATLLHGAGRIAADQSDYASAQTWYRASLTISQELGDRHGRATTLYALGHFALDQGDLPAARSMTEESLALFREFGDEAGLAAALELLGYIAFLKGEAIQAHTLLEEGLILFRRLGDQQGIGLILETLGRVALETLDVARAGPLIEEALAVFRSLGARQGISGALNGLADVARVEGDYRRAEALQRESLALRRELGDLRGSVVALYNLGTVALAQGDVDRAATRFDESIVLNRRVGYRPGMVMGLMGLGAVAGSRGRARQAARLFGAAEVLAESIGYVLDAPERAHYERTTATARAQLDEATWALAWSEGRGMTFEQALAADNRTSAG